MVLDSSLPMLQVPWLNKVTSFAPGTVISAFPYLGLSITELRSSSWVPANPSCWIGPRGTLLLGQDWESLLQLTPKFSPTYFLVRRGRKLYSAKGKAMTQPFCLDIGIPGSRACKTHWRTHIRQMCMPLGSLGRLHHSPTWSAGEQSHWLGLRLGLGLRLVER